MKKFSTPFTLTSNGVLWAAVLIISAAAALVLVFYRIYFPGSIQADHKAFAEFGSFVGGTIGPLLTFFTVIFLLISLINQREELSKSSSLLTQERRRLDSDNARRYTDNAKRKLEQLNDRPMFNSKSFAESQFLTKSELGDFANKLGGELRREDFGIKAFRRRWILCFQDYLIFLNSDVCRHLDKYEISAHLQTALDYLSHATVIYLIEKEEFYRTLRTLRALVFANIEDDENRNTLTQWIDEAREIVDSFILPNKSSK